MNAPVGDTPSRQAEQGFTLIEILLAILIFLTGVTGVYALLSTGLGMQRKGTEISRLGRQLDQLVQQLELEISAGMHYDASARIWHDIELGRLPDGSFFRARFFPEQGNEALGTLVVELSMARNEAGLERARPVGCVLTPGPTQAEAIRGWRTRQRGLERAGSVQAQKDGNP